MRLSSVAGPDDYPRKPCFGCGGKASAMWVGDGDVFVCGACALDYLPKLIADAVGVGAVNPVVDFERALVRAEAGFWKAVASRLAADNRQLRRRDGAAVTSGDPGAEGGR